MRLIWLSYRMIFFLDSFFSSKNECMGNMNSLKSEFSPTGNLPKLDNK